MKKGILEMCILAIISKEEVYASDIIDRLKSGNLIVVEGTLYPMLSRLKKAGHLDHYWQESQAGPPRKYYRLTPEGEEFLQNLSTSWEEMVKSVSSLTSKNKSNNE